MSSLKCKYCGGRISLTDKKCPGCGASTSDVIDEALKEKEKQEKELFDKQQENVEKVFSSFGKTFLSVRIIFVVVFIVVVGTIVFGFTRLFKSADSNNHNNNSNNIVNVENKIVKVGFNEEAVSSNYKVVVDKVDTFNMVQDHSSYTTGIQKDGYQQMAFKIKITNISKSELSFYSDIHLLADGVQTKSSAIDDNKGFRHEKDHKVFEELEDTVIKDAAVQGWVGFYVPNGTKTLELKIKDDVVIEFENPYFTE